ncbi:MAG TPA: neutral/alkaline non-lysosomal ceramidase N-terminal domain-containing protein [Blastocatellia bacterium]|nr:neutral/alkaline non-lysosomal ceramidase N-terminal domain-containing protein [Blastocatellia bacterium]
MATRRSSTFLFTLLLAVFALPCLAQDKAATRLMAGAGKADITPPVGTPLAGYGGRLGKPSTGVHDPCEARALIIDNGAEKIAFVSVDHLGYDNAMVTRVRTLAAERAGIAPDHIFVMSSHTHSGGGAYLEPFPILAGKFDPKIRDLYSERAAEAVIAASKTLRPARIAIGAGGVPGLSRFRSIWPPHAVADKTIDPEVGVLRVDDAASGKPMAVLFNFAAHPTILNEKNFQFSADYPGVARAKLEQMIGGDVLAIFANGAQGTVAPRPFQGSDEWQRVENMGTILAAEVFKVIHMIKPQDWMEMKFTRTPLVLKTVPPPKMPAQVKLPEAYPSEMSAVAFDRKFAFVTIPGELGSILNQQVKERGRLLGFESTFLLGLTNDAVGYIITEDEYRHGTYESSISLFGPAFGSFITNEAFQALEKVAPAAEKKAADR